MMVEALVVYGTIAVLLMLVGAILTYLEYRPSDKRFAARMAILAPAWPLLALYGAFWVGPRYVLRKAEWGRS